MSLRDDICKSILFLEDGSSHAVCRRSVEHVGWSREEKRLHYDPDRGGVYWNDTGEVIDED